MNKLYIRLKDVNEFTRFIIERKRVEDQLKRDKDDAEYKNRVKSDFLASMSHELRTPLNHIIGFTELLIDKHFGGLNNAQEECLNDILDSSHHLLALINDILDLSKVEAGKMDLSLAEIHLDTFLENCTLIIKDQAYKHNINVSVNKKNLPETLTADERKLKQIMYNLLSNAMKFTPDGGSICINCRKISDPYIKVNAQTRLISGNFIKLSVQDTGIGLEPSDMKLIFNPFDQVDNALTQRHNGTGLGLSLTKRLVELHGGEIWVESQGKDKGSTFHFILPD